MLTEAEIGQALRDLEKKKRDSISAIEAEYDADVEALMRTKKILGLNGVHVEGQQLVSVWPGLRPAIRNFVDGSNGEFTLDDVVFKLEAYKDGPDISRGAVSTELWKMSHGQNATIRLVKKGRPNIYVKI